jgi:TATA-box binding protein (TBP) (component of TFIID and TFIIIB)
VFREFHIKVFNTGKLEIPGVQSDEMFEMVLENIITILQPHIDTQISYNQKSDTVLINSNFNCGFYINREVLYDLLKYKYHIHAIYDPCSYPGIQCKFYFNNESKDQTGIQLAADENSESITTVSFMIFRTGSVLIVGMCEEYVLNVIYEFLTNLLKTEFEKICQSVFDDKHIILKDKKKKIRKKTIVITIQPTITNVPITNAPIINAADEEFVIQCSSKSKGNKSNSNSNKANKSNSNKGIKQLIQ